MARATTPTFILFAVLTAASARADEVDNTRAIEAAKKSFELGMQQFNANDLEGARISLAQSYGAWPSINALKNLAIAEINTGHPLDALKHFKVYARSPNADREFINTRLPAFLERCNQQTGHLRIVADATREILIDGKKVLDRSEPVDVLPGNHAVNSNRGSELESRAVSVAAGQTIEVRFDAPATSSRGPTAATSSIAPEPRDRDSGFWTAQHTWAVGLGAAAVTSAAVGLGFGAAASSKKSTLDGLTAGHGSSDCAGTSASSSLCSDIHDAKSSQRTDGQVANIAFVATGVFAVATVSVLAFWPRSKTERGASIQIAPSFGPGNASVLAVGHF